MSDLVAKLRAVDHMSVEDCFLQSPLFAQAADRIEELENADLPQTPRPASEWALAEITRLQKELETAREALEDIARQRLPVEIDEDLDPDFIGGYEACVLVARRATKGGRE